MLQSLWKSLVTIALDQSSDVVASHQRVIPLASRSDAHLSTISREELFSRVIVYLFPSLLELGDKAVLGYSSFVSSSMLFSAVTRASG